VTDAAATLPTGTVTMLFSDIEGSTKLLDRLGGAYRDVLTLQRRIIRAAVRAHDGIEMGTEGDSFFVVFSSAGDAVRAAVRAQLQLQAAAWPAEGRVRVRMGLHTGEPERHEDGYVGMDVHCAARVAGTAHGGQVVVTEATWGLAADTAGDVSARDLGWHRLKDISGPQRLYRLRAPGLEEVSAEIKSLGATASLPEPPTPIIDRHQELAQARELFASGRRLVTLVGPAGVGKTRLALAVAAERAAVIRDGVYFVSLARATGGDDMWSAITEAVGTPPENRDPPTFLTHIGQRQLLIVLDNLEQLHGAAGIAAQLLAAAPQIEVLTTSRSPLHIQGEQLLPVEPLSESGAVVMFTDQMRRVRPDFEVAGEDAAAVATLCRRVDGLPLAIELLSARGRMLTPRAMLSRLDSVLEIRSRSDSPARQQSLVGALDWSWDLLPPDRAAALARLGVFAGPFGIDDAAAIADLDGDDVLDVLLDLVEASLVRVREGAGGEPVFRMLRVVTRYAAHRLAQEGEAEVTAARHRHAVCVAAFVDRVQPQLRTARHIAARDEIVGQHGNIRAALAWTLRTDGADVLTGLEICRSLSWYWYACGYAAEGRRWLDRAVEVSETRNDPAAVRALHGLGVLVLQQGRFEEGADMLRRCLTFWRQVGDREGEGKALNSLGVAEWSMGNRDAARVNYTAAAEIARADVAPDRLSTALSNLALLEAPENPHLTLELMQEVLAIDEAQGDAWGIGADRLNIASAHLLTGNVDVAQSQLLEHGSAMVALGDVELSVDLVENLAHVCYFRGADSACARLLVCADQNRVTSGIARTVPDAERVAAFADAARDRLGETAWEDSYVEGARLSLEDALAEARAALADDGAR
jgi:predicted ATPase/class 3 adenylate cyclase